MDKQNGSETLTVQEVREILQLGANSAYNLIHSKAFPVKKVGHSYRIPVKAFYAWIEGSPPARAAIADTRP